MQRLKSWLATLALLAGALPAPAQTVYRCGNSYSQTPCEGGSRVPSDDSRTDAQRASAREGAARDQALAHSLEASRRTDAAESLARDKALAAASARQAAQARAEHKAQEKKDTDAKRQAARKKPGKQGARAPASQPAASDEPFTVKVDTGTPPKKTKP